MLTKCSTRNFECEHELVIGKFSNAKSGKHSVVRKLNGLIFGLYVLENY